MKKLPALLLALALLGALSSCASPLPAVIPDETPAGETPEVTLAPALEGTLNVATTSESYGALFDKFTLDTGIKVEFLSMSSGEVLSKVRAEGGAPTTDLWFGGGIDAFMQAKEEGLLEPVLFPEADKIAETFKDGEGYWYAKGITVVGFLVNNDLLAEENLPIPQTWGDLTDPVYRGEILMSNPAISGTNYAVVNAMLQQKGEADGWDYFAALDKNIDYYAKRGKDPSVKCAAGEVAVGITYLDGTITKLEEEHDVTVVYPTDGLPYIPDGVAVFKGAANVPLAKEFVRWLYADDENLQLLAKIDQKTYIKLIKPSMEGVVADFDESLLMEEDLSLLGRNREPILARWEELTGGKETRE